MKLAITQFIGLKLGIKMFCIVCLLFFVPALGLTSYSDVYDEELDNKSLLEPIETIKIATERLENAELKGDIETQLIMYYYIASANATLSRQDEYESVVRKGLVVAKKNNNIRFMSEFVGFESAILLYQGDLRGAVRKANIALQYAKQTDDYRLIGSMLVVRSEAQQATENYTLALKDIETALEIFKKNNDEIVMSYSYNVLAIIYDSLEEYDLALKYYEVSLLYDKTGSLYNKATMLYNIGTTYLYKGDEVLAIKNLEQSAELSKEINDEANLAYANYSLAEIYLNNKKFLAAEEKALLSHQWFVSSNDLLMHVNNNLLLAEIYTQNKEYSKAKNLIVIVDEQMKGISAPRYKLSLLIVKIGYQAAIKNWDKAYQLSQQLLEKREDLYKVDKTNSIAELKLKYDSQFDQEKMESLQEQYTLQKQSLLQEKVKHKYFLGLIALAGIILVGLFWAFRNQLLNRKRLYLMTIKDDLTNVANRRYILDLLSQVHKSSIENKQSYAIVMIDLDFFKSINDNYGHYKGNEVLIHFAKVVKCSLPEGCTIGRLGGEEWLLLLPKLNKSDTALLLEKIRKNYNNPRLLNLPIEKNLHFSSGVKICLGDCLEVKNTLRKIDDAMYKAKNQGRNQDVYI